MAEERQRTDTRVLLALTSEDGASVVKRGRPLKLGGAPVSGGAAVAAIAVLAPAVDTVTVELGTVPERLLLAVAT